MGLAVILVVCLFSETGVAALWVRQKIVSKHNCDVGSFWISTASGPLRLRGLVGLNVNVIEEVNMGSIPPPVEALFFVG